MTRRELFEMLYKAAALLGGGAMLMKSQKTAAGVPPTQTRPPPQPGAGDSYMPVVTLNGGRLPWTMEGDVKVFRLTAEPVQREFAPGMVVNCWGYNGQTPGPTIEAVEGDRIRILVSNRLPAATSIHWHGLFLPNGMDGVGGLNQPHIPPGKTYVYEFTLRQNGTFMYHPHSDEVVQLAMGMMGMFVVHPKIRPQPRIDRDYCILLHAWDIEPGTYTAKPATMTEFNLWTFNSRVFPGIDAMVARVGERVRIRLGNLSMHDHPIHIHGHAMWVTGTDGGWIPASGQWPETSVNVPVGAVRVVEFVAEAPGDWAFHCHKVHHMMNPMGHAIPNMIGVDQSGVAERITSLLPGYMAMGETGMSDMAHRHGDALPENTLPMMSGTGPFGAMDGGGMFTVIKIREDQAVGDYRDPGWYRHPQGTMAHELR
ncbi:MAG: multicopper oxidase family protein [Gammaproteobacteria bacterium]